MRNMEQNSKKIILDLCGGTGAWSKPYKDAGYDVRVITLPKFDVTQVSFLHDAILFHGLESSNWDGRIPYKNVYGILAAPPCTKFSRAAWQLKKKDRDFAEGMKCVRACMEIIWKVQEQAAPLAFWAMENPQGYLYNFMGMPYFIFQPWQFGQTDFRATKRTGLWGYFNPPAKTVRTRTIPFISPRSSKRDTVDKQRENHAWYKASAEDRAKTCEHFAKAFYKANQ